MIRCTGKRLLSKKSIHGFLAHRDSYPYTFVALNVAFTAALSNPGILRELRLIKRLDLLGKFRGVSWAFSHVIHFGPSSGLLPPRELYVPNTSRSLCNWRTRWHLQVLHSYLEIFPRVGNSKALPLTYPRHTQDRP